MNIGLGGVLKDPLSVRVARGGLRLSAESSLPRFVVAAGKVVSLMNIIGAGRRKMLCR